MLSVLVHWFEKAEFEPSTPESPSTNATMTDAPNGGNYTSVSNPKAQTCGQW
jgi:hypothetical protein